MEKVDTRTLQALHDKHHHHYNALDAFIEHVTRDAVSRYRDYREYEVGEMVYLGSMVYCAKQTTRGNAPIGTIDDQYWAVASSSSGYPMQIKTFKVTDIDADGNLAVGMGSSEMLVFISSPDGAEVKLKDGVQYSAFQNDAGSYDVAFATRPADDTYEITVVGNMTSFWGDFDSSIINLDEINMGTLNGNLVEVVTADNNGVMTPDMLDRLENELATKAEVETAVDKLENELATKVELETAVDKLENELATKLEVETALAGKADLNHTHADKADVGHTHADKANVNHTHQVSEITNYTGGMPMLKTTAGVGQFREFPQAVRSGSGFDYKYTITLPAGGTWFYNSAYSTTRVVADGDNSGNYSVVEIEGGMLLGVANGGSVLYTFTNRSSDTSAVTRTTGLPTGFCIRLS